MSILIKDKSFSFKLTQPEYITKSKKSETMTFIHKNKKIIAHALNKWEEEI